jgi:hypothetical protein
MSSISRNSLSGLEELCQNCDVLSRIREKDQLWAFGNRMVKIVGPYSCSKAKSAFFPLVDIIIVLAFKIIHAIGRLLTGQSDEKTIQKLEKLTDQVLEELQRKFQVADQEYYTVLGGLGQIQINLKAAYKCGLMHYKKACEEGTPYLIKAAPEIRKTHADRIQLILDKICTQIFPQLKVKIVEMQSELIGKLKIGKPKELIKQLKAKSQNKISNLQSSLVSLNTRIFDGGVCVIGENEVEQMYSDLNLQSQNVKLAMVKAVFEVAVKEHESLSKVIVAFDSLSEMFIFLGPKESYIKLSSDQKEEYLKKLATLEKEVEMHESKLPNQPVELKIAVLMTKLSARKLRNSIQQKETPKKLEMVSCKQYYFKHEILGENLLPL